MMSRRAFFQGCLLLGFQYLLPLYTTAGAADVLWQMAGGESRPHHKGDGFRNHPPIPEHNNTSWEFYWQRFLDEFKEFALPDDFCLPPDRALSEYRRRSNSPEDTITWIGHSTFVLTVNGRTMLLDPFFTERASPFRWAGPRRYTPPGIAADDLGHVDAILVSHNHYDHLDVETLGNLTDKEKITVFAPLGVGTLFREIGYVRIREHDWWQCSNCCDLRISFLPAVHSSGRGRRDQNKTLWGSWAVQSCNARYYFAGDTAYSNTLFKTIGRIFGGFDLAIVPIGAYAPRRYMRYRHASPGEAVCIGQDIGAERLVPCHWGTIPLSAEPPLEPPERFRHSGIAAGYRPENLWMMKIGQTRCINRT